MWYGGWSAVFFLGFFFAGKGVRPHVARPRVDEDDHRGGNHQPNQFRETRQSRQPGNQSANHQSDPGNDDACPGPPCHFNELKMGSMHAISPFSYGGIRIHFLSDDEISLANRPIRFKTTVFNTQNPHESLYSLSCSHPGSGLPGRLGRETKYSFHLCR